MLFICFDIKMRIEFGKGDFRFGQIQNPNSLKNIKKILIIKKIRFNKLSFNKIFNENNPSKSNIFK